MAGMAIACTGVGPLVNSRPPSARGATRISASSFKRPSRVHDRMADVSSLLFLNEFLMVLDGNESSWAERGAAKGIRDLALADASSFDLLKDGDSSTAPSSVRDIARGLNDF